MSFLLLALFSESAAIIARLSIVYKYFLKRNSSSIQFVENMLDSSLKWKRNIFVNRNRHFAPAMTFHIRWYLKYAFKLRISVEFAEKRQINHNNLRKKFKLLLERGSNYRHHTFVFPENHLLSNMMGEAIIVLENARMAWKLFRKFLTSLNHQSRVPHPIILSCITSKLEHTNFVVVDLKLDLKINNPRWNFAQDDNNVFGDFSQHMNTIAKLVWHQLDFVSTTSSKIKVRFLE